MSYRRAIDANAGSMSSGARFSPSSSNSTRWKKMPRSASVCCSAWMMLPPCRYTNSATVETFGRIDFLVSNAAMVPYAGPMMGASGERFGRAIGINAWASVALAQHAMPAGLADGGGAIVNVSAGGARLAVPDIAEYNA